MILEAVIIAVVVFFVRLWPRRNKPVLGVDLWGLLLDARAIKRNDYRVPRKVSEHLVGDRFDQPPLFYYLLALLPQKNVASRTRFLSPAFDVLHAWLTAAIAFALTGNPWVALAAGLLYAVAPVTVYESFMLTMRPFASLLYSLFFLSLLAAFFSGAWWFWIASVVLSAMIFLTHKMTTQTMVFACVAFFAFTFNPLFLLALVAGLVLAMASSNGFYLEVARGHAAILAFWRKNIDKRRKCSSDAEWFLKSVAKLAFNPWLLFVLALALTRALSAWEQALFAWVAVTVGLAVLTSFKQLAFLGENQRYLEYGALPAFVLAATYLFEAHWITHAIALLFVLAGFVLLWVAWRKLLSAPRIERNEELFECVGFLKKRREKNVVCLPGIDALIAYCADKRVFSASSPRLFFKHPCLVFKEETVQALDGLIREYGLELLVADKKTDSVALKRFGKKVFDNKAYKVYALKKKGERKK